jgi:hypothetical protein
VGVCVSIIERLQCIVYVQRLLKTVELVDYFVTFVVLLYATVTHTERTSFYRFVLTSYSTTLIFKDTVDSRAFVILLQVESLFLNFVFVAQVQ